LIEPVGASLPSLDIRARAMGGAPLSGCVFPPWNLLACGFGIAFGRRLDRLGALILNKLVVRLRSHSAS